MQKENIISYHSLSIEESFEILQSQETGLKHKESQDKLEIFGLNSFTIEEKFSYGKAIWENVKNPFSLILILAIVISFSSGHIADGLIIFAVLVLNSYIDIYHQKNAHTNIELLKKGVITTSTVIRDGSPIKIDSIFIVPGDIVVLEEGQIVPADGRLIEQDNLHVNESSLTGESMPVKKHIQRIHGILPTSDIYNMVWCGSIVTEGSGKFLVTATGFNTQFGELTKKLNQTKRGSNPFLDRIKKLSKFLGIGGIIIVFIIFIIHFGILGSDIQEITIFSLAVLVSIIPESLPTVINITLARGAKYLADEHAVVKELSTIESVGSTTVIITDKTGTITENTMRVEHIITSNNKKFSVTGFGWKSVGMFLHNNQRFDIDTDEHLTKILEFSVLATRAHVYQEEEERDIVIGEPTEAALLVMAQKAHKQREELLQSYSIIQRTRFISSQKILTTILEKDGEMFLITIGAPETIWKYSDIDQEIITQTEYLAHQGLRTIAFAYAKITDIPKNYEDLPSLFYLGFVGMRDPIREGVKESIMQAKEAGIRVIMATGDHLKTASYIAREIGILKDTNQIIEGLEFLSLDEKTQKEKLKHIQVFARVTPEVKLLVTKILQKNKEIVTMIGDGVNDTLALKQADVGIAMGNSGTDAARSASSIVLTNDNFTTVVHAIFRGRHVYKNIKQVTNFLLSTNASEALVLIVATFLGSPLPLIATQILLINLVTDGIGALPFAFKKPRNTLIPREKPGVFLNSHDYGIISSATIGMAVATLIAFKLSLSDGQLQYAQSMAFITLSLTQISRLVSFGDYSFKIKTINSNPWFVRSILISIGILIAVFTIPILKELFGLITLSMHDILIAISLSTIPFITVKIYKLFLGYNKNHD